MKVPRPGRSTDLLAQCSANVFFVTASDGLSAGPWCVESASEEEKCISKEERSQMRSALCAPQDGPEKAIRSGEDV